MGDTFGATYTAIFCKFCPVDAVWLPYTRGYHLAGMTLAVCFVGGLVSTQDPAVAELHWKCCNRHVCCDVLRTVGCTQDRVAAEEHKEFAIPNEDSHCGKLFFVDVV